MFKTEDIHDVFTKQIGVKIGNETARQQTPAPEPTDVDRANALGDRILEIIFRGAENDPPDDIKPQPHLIENPSPYRQRQKPATTTTTTVETSNPQTGRHRPTAYRITRLQPR
jgi:hypothetical protein